MVMPVHNKSQLLALLSDHKEKIKSFGVHQLGIFGSFATDANISPSSDVDFLIEFVPEKKNYDNFIELSFFLEELTGRKIELVTKESLSPYIGPHILKQVEHVGF